MCVKKGVVSTADELERTANAPLSAHAKLWSRDQIEARYADRKLLLADVDLLHKRKLHTRFLRWQYDLVAWGYDSISDLELNSLLKLYIELLKSD